MTHDLRIYDGEKAVRLEDLPPEAWRVITGGAIGGDAEVKKLWKAVPWLFRGVNIRAAALSKMPFTIFDGDNEIDSSKNYQNALGWWPNPEATLFLIESSLTLMGRAYVFKVRNRLRKIEALRYLVPTSITPKIDDQVGLISFKRQLSQGEIELVKENLVWFWMRDAFTEIGPPSTSPGKNALRAANVLFDVDNFVGAFFKRGAIKATLLTVPRGTAEDQRDRLESWWRKVFSGVGNAWAARVLNADAVKAVTVGEGIQELSNTDLTDEKREDIAIALGIPKDVLFSDAANLATAKQDDFRLYDQTVNNQAKFIQGVLNTLLFNPLDFSIKFHPEVLQVSQEEEVQRSGALVNLERANIPPWTGVKVLGFDFPPDVTDEQIEEEIREYMEFKSELNISPADAETNPRTPGSPQGVRSVLGEYLKHALRRHKAGKTIKGTKDAPPFEHDGLLDNTFVAAIGGALNAAKTEADIKRIFRNAEADEREHKKHIGGNLENVWENYP